MRSLLRRMLLACGTGLAVFAYLSTPAPVAAEAYGPETCSTCIESGLNHSFLENCCLPSSTDCYKRGGGHAGGASEYGRCWNHEICPTGPA